MDKTTYRSGDFYCYDEKGIAIGLELRPKIFIQPDKLLIAQLSKFEGITGFERLDNGNFVIDFIEDGYLNFVLSVLNSFPERVLPVIVWKGQECIPGNSIILETKSPVEIDLLKKRLANFGNFSIIRLAEISPRVYELSVGNLKVPSNIFVLANLIAEDSAYVKWARPLFHPIYESMQVFMYVTSGGLDSLGDKRFLHLDIHILDKKITILKDLMPQLGEGDFALSDDIWFWADKPVITETEKDMERIVSFVWPFIYLETGEITFPEIKIPYSEISGSGKTEKQFSTKGCKFQISSVLKGIDPPIEDIQPVHQYSSSLLISNTALPTISYWETYRPIASLISFCLAVLISYHFLLIPVLDWIKSMEKDSIVIDSDIYLNNLVASTRLSIPNWKINYQNMESKLKIVVEHFDLTSSRLLKDITNELERVYRDEDRPSSEDMEILISNIKSLILICQRKELAND